MQVICLDNTENMEIIYEDRCVKKRIYFRIIVDEQ